jgi:hypothetical protein
VARWTASEIQQMPPSDQSLQEQLQKPGSASIGLSFAASNLRLSPEFDPRKISECIPIPSPPLAERAFRPRAWRCPPVRADRQRL